MTNSYPDEKNNHETEIYNREIPLKLNRKLKITIRIILKTEVKIIIIIARTGDRILKFWLHILPVFIWFRLCVYLLLRDCSCSSVFYFLSVSLSISVFDCSFGQIDILSWLHCHHYTIRPRPFWLSVCMFLFKLRRSSSEENGGGGGGTGGSPNHESWDTSQRNKRDERNGKQDHRLRTHVTILYEGE